MIVGSQAIFSSVLLNSYERSFLFFHEAEMGAPHGCSRRNAIVPFHLSSNYMNAKLVGSHGSGTIGYRLMFLLTGERYRSVPQLFLKFFYSLQQERHPAQKSNFFVAWTSLHLIAYVQGNGTEQNDSVLFHIYFIFHI